MSTIDAPRDVRRGEEIDLAVLSPYLRRHVDGFDGEVELEQFPSGYSNLTYLLKCGDTEVVLRRPPFGANVESGHDMSREWRVLNALAPVFDRVPRPIHHCADPDVIGAPFYVMTRVRGTILRGQALDVPGLDEIAMRAACLALVDTLADIHAVDLAAAGLVDFGRPEGYVVRQIEGWTRRWHRARTDDVPTVERAMAWLADNVPPEVDAVLIHNDFKYDNVVYDPDDFSRIRAVLDWEMATIGDPLMDLGTSLSYWIEPHEDVVLQMVAGPTARPGSLPRREVVARYAEQTGRDVGNILFYYVYGLFKGAVIGQQIYARYQQGHTKDPRFAGLGFLVNACGERAVAAIESGDI